MPNTHFLSSLCSGSLMSATPDTLIWMDLEMTGLDPFQDHILELAIIVTNAQLETLAEGPVIAIHQPDSILQAMDDWNISHHSASGLIERVRSSTCDEQQAEQLLLEFVRHYSHPGCSPLCGNTICQDRRFLARFMPTLEAFMHYRNLDVSTIKILAQHWAPQILPGFSKENRHEALADIRESIAELQYYRQTFFQIVPAATETA
jgi:oligoribonuclease